MAVNIWITKIPLGCLPGPLLLGFQGQRLGRKREAVPTAGVCRGRCVQRPAGMQKASAEIDEERPLVAASRGQRWQLLLSIGYPELTDPF